MFLLLTYPQCTPSQCAHYEPPYIKLSECYMTCILFSWPHYSAYTKILLFFSLKLYHHFQNLLLLVIYSSNDYLLLAHFMYFTVIREFYPCPWIRVNHLCEFFVIISYAQTTVHAYQGLPYKTHSALATLCYCTKNTVCASIILIPHNSVS